MAFIPEITTRVSVEADMQPLTDCINMMEDDDILSACFSDVITDLKNKYDETERLVDALAESAAEGLSAYQSAIIKTKHKQTGMMVNSVDVMKDGEGAYLVGNTATSVDGFPYPLAIEEGTKDHWVEPITFQALHWIDKRTREHCFSRGHMVSGITPDPFVDYSIENLDAHISEILKPLDDVWR